jgi:hypothetical protein
MIHATYVKAHPKAKWVLASIAKSAEAAKQDKQASLQEAKKKGHKEAEAAIQTYSSSWLLPETLKELQEEDEAQLYN